MPLVTVATLCLLSPGEASAQIWNKPYADGSSADQQLRFSFGPAAAVTAPLPVPPYAGIGYSSVPAFGPGGGWGLSASGSTVVGSNTPPLPPVNLATSRAQTEATGTGAMQFNIINTGLLSELATVSLPMNWSADVTIAGSDTWAAPSTSYIYEFDAILNNSLLSGNPDIFGDITLTISAGSSTIYQATGLSDIFGIVDLLPENIGVQVAFDYDQSEGPLSIQWSASSVVGGQILGGLGASDTIYQISGGAIYVDAIPEPGTYALMIGGVGLLWLLRRRKSARSGPVTV